MRRDSCEATLARHPVRPAIGRGERGYDHRHKDSNGRSGKDHQIAAERIQRSTVESEVGIEHAEWFSIEKQAGMARGANFTRLHPGQPKVVNPVPPTFL